MYDCTTQYFVGPILLIIGIILLSLSSKEKIDGKYTKKGNDMVISGSILLSIGVLLLIVVIVFPAFCF